MKVVKIPVESFSKTSKMVILQNCAIEEGYYFALNLPREWITEGYDIDDVLSMCERFTGQDDPIGLVIIALLSKIPNDKKIVCGLFGLSPYSIHRLIDFLTLEENEKESV
jgi:hypothetical protein